MKYYGKGKLKMEIKKIEKLNAEGKLDVMFALTEPQTQLLLEFAINMLVGKGLITFAQEEEKEAKEFAEKQMSFSFPAPPASALKN